MPTGRRIASKVFSWELQEQFASVSGDRNPMHMDEVAARRTQAGQPVVHGIHTLLWALDALVASNSLVSPVVRIRVKFLKWVYVGDEPTLTIPIGESGEPQSLQVDVLGMPVLMADFTYGEWTHSDWDIPEETPLVAPRSVAIERPFAEMKDCAGGAFTASSQAVRGLFPQLTRYFTDTAVAELAACSYIVGMEVPGLYSMFSKLDVALFPAADPKGTPTGLHYRVVSLDDRFHKVRISVAGRAITGLLETFARLPPVRQASMQTIAADVFPKEFAGMRALIVGGSRGLGELTAKLIAAGGGKPTITYARGKSDAEAVCREILEWGAAAEVVAYDVLQPPDIQLALLGAHVTHLFYFATNPIFRPKGDLVSPYILADFVAFYLQGFHDLCMYMIERNRDFAPDVVKLIAYYPSSIAVKERPAGMTEYAMVKAAGEQMCRDMNQYLPNLQIVTTRLPRLRTDQTAGVIPERDGDALKVMLDIVRQMNSPDSDIALAKASSQG